MFGAGCGFVSLTDENDAVCPENTGCAHDIHVAKRQGYYLDANVKVT